VVVFKNTLLLLNPLYRLAKLMLRFGGGMNLNNYHEEAVHQLDINAARSIGIMNDIYSFEKEIQTSQASGTDIASLCSSVEVVSRECKVKADTAKDILLTICRDWERQHEALSEEIISRSPELSSYCTALGYLISGNEAWSKETFRYKHGLTARQNLD
jgi:aristolochene synthase